MTVGIGFLAVLALAAAAIDTSVVEGVNVQQKVETYPVTGNTARQLLDAMNARARPDPVSGKPTYGRTDSHVSWRYRTESRDGRRCKLRSADVKLAIVITLPQWEPAGAPPALQAKWQDFHAALTAHELQHRALALQAAREIRDMLKDLPAADCKALNAEVERLAAPVMQRLADASRDYDVDTQHGRSEGAFWQAD